MHEYYTKNQGKLKKTMNSYLKLIAPEIEKEFSKAYSDVLEETWDYYFTQLLEKFPYIGGDKASGTKNLTGAYYFVALGDIGKKYGVPLERWGYLITISYQRYFAKMPGFVKYMMGKMFTNPKKLTKMFLKKDIENAKNAARNPGSFETKTMVPPEEGYDFSYHTVVCPLADFSKKHGYEEYMPYLCNLDYVMFTEVNAPLYREYTCAADGDYCDFKLKLDAPVMDYWPPVFTQGKGYK